MARCINGLCAHNCVAFKVVHSVHNNETKGLFVNDVNIGLQKIHVPSRLQNNPRLSPTITSSRLGSILCMKSFMRHPLENPFLIITDIIWQSPSPMMMTTFMNNT